MSLPPDPFGPDDPAKEPPSKWAMLVAGYVVVGVLVVVALIFLIVIKFLVNVASGL